MKNNISTNSNQFVWILAIAPLLGVVLQALAANVFIISFNSLWVITIAINVLVAIYDVESLKKQNRYKLDMGNPMLIPVYLYRRAKSLNQPLNYFVLWCLSLLIALLIPSWKITAMVGALNVF